jgi:hypothetical protein
MRPYGEGGGTTKKGWWSGSRCRPEFKPQYHKKKKKRVKNEIFMEPIFMNFAFQKIVLQ